MLVVAVKVHGVAVLRKWHSVVGELPERNGSVIVNELMIALPVLIHGVRTAAEPAQAKRDSTGARATGDVLRHSVGNGYAVGAGRRDPTRTSATMRHSTRSTGSHPARRRDRRSWFAGRR